MSEKDAEESKCRAEWLHKNNAPKNWIILTNSEISTIRAEFEAMERERDEAIIQLENIKASSIHTCHDKCQRPMCVLRRERDELRMQIKATQKNLSSIHQWIERNHPDGFIDSLTCLQNLDRVTDNWYDRYDRLEVDACRFVRERDEAREQVNHYRDKLDLSPISWDI